MMDLENDLVLPTASGIATYPPGATFGPRRMADYEFVWVIQGNAEYTWGGMTVFAPEGAIVLCRPGAVDFFRWDPQNRTRHAYFHFQITDSQSSWPSESEWPLVRMPDEGDILVPLFRYLMTWIGRGEPFQIRLTLLSLLGAFITGQAAAGEVPRDALPEPVERAWEYLHNQLEEDPMADIDLNALARAACVTPEHLCRMFKTATGYTPVQTVRLARLDHAAVLLARSNYSVGEIAHLSGFSSPFHFSRRFREAFGVTPTEIRKQIREGRTPPLPRLLRILHST